MKKAKEHPDRFFSLRNLSMIVAIAGVISAAIYFMEDRYNQKKEFEDLIKKVERIVALNHTLRIELEINAKSEEITHIEKRLIFLQKNYKNPLLYEMVTKEQVNAEIRDLPNGRMKLIKEINELIKIRMSYEQLLHE